MVFILFDGGVTNILNTPGTFKSPLIQPVNETQAANAPHAVDNNNQKNMPSVPHREKHTQYKAEYPQEDDTANQLLAKDIMTHQVISITQNIDLVAAWAFLLEHKFRHIPVVDHKKKMLGLLSDRDLLRFTSVLQENKAIAETPLKKISDIMISRILTATEETPIKDIVHAMLVEHIGSIPIINDEEQLVGIITRSDLLTAIMNSVPINSWA